MQAQNSNLKHRDHEIYGLEEEVDWTSDQRRNYPLQDRRIATQYTSKVCVCSDSILCLCGNVKIVLGQEKTWENDRIREFVQGPEYQPYYDITGRPAELVWRIFVEKTTIEIIERIKTMEEKGTQPSESQDRIIFTSMHNDCRYWRTSNRNECCDNAPRVAQYILTFKPGHWSFLGRGDENNWYGSLANKPDGEGDSTTKIMMQEFAESTHAVFKCSFTFSRGVR